MKKALLSVLAAALFFAAPVGASTGVSPPDNPYQSWMLDAHQHVPWPQHTLALSYSYCYRPYEWYACVVLTASGKTVAAAEYRAPFDGAVGIIYGQEQYDAGTIGPQLQALGYQGSPQYYWPDAGVQGDYGVNYSRCARVTSDRSPSFCQTL